MLKKILSLCLFLLVCDCIYSQSDSLLLKRLSKPIVNCEIVATNSQELIAGYSSDQVDNIYKVMYIWEATCGNVEPIQRLKILCDIQFNRLVDAMYNDYIDYGVYVYKNRVNAGKSNTRLETFELNKAYFSYVPLNGKFDELTRNWALQLLPQQTVGSTPYYFCLLFSDKLEQFDKEANNNTSPNNYIHSRTKEKMDNTYNSISFEGQIGAWYPIGQMNNLFKISPQFGITASAAFHKSWRLSLGFLMRVFIDDKPIELNINHTVQTANNNFGLTFGAWLIKEYNLKHNYFIDGVAGLGVGAIDNDYKDDKENSHGIETVDFSLGVNFRKKISRSNHIGLNISYHLAPYNFDPELKTKIGYQFVTTNLIFRF